MIKKFLEDHEEIFLAIAGLALLSGMIAMVVWGISQVSVSLDTALESGKGTAGSSLFHISDAEKANLRGLSSTGP